MGINSLDKTLTWKKKLENLKRHLNCFVQLSLYFSSCSYTQIGFFFNYLICSAFLDISLMNKLSGLLIKVTLSLSCSNAVKHSVCIRGSLKKTH